MTITAICARVTMPSDAAHSTAALYHGPSGTSAKGSGRIEAISADAVHEARVQAVVDSRFVFLI